MNHRDYRENRARFSQQELSLYRGQWVAFSMDGTRVIASHPDLSQLDDLVRANGETPEHVALEHIGNDEAYVRGPETS